MIVWRRWIFPILMVIACGAIAASLVQLAFFPEEEAAAAQPGVEIAETTVEATRGSVANELVLSGTVARDETVTVRSETDLATHPTITLTGDLAGVYQVIGFTPREWLHDTEKTMTMLVDTYTQRVPTLPDGVSPTYEVWVPPADAPDVGAVLAMDLRERRRGRRGERESHGLGFTPREPGLGTRVRAHHGCHRRARARAGRPRLVNIQLVPMRQRIREIGVRRSFGATAGRIFTSVLLENVVATAVAGAIGIAIAVAVLRTPAVLAMFGGMQDIPAFPLRAALLGLVAAVAIGALAGFLPALTAVRSRVIDTLRY